MSRPNTSKTSQEQRQTPGVSSAFSAQAALTGSWDALLALQNAVGNQAVGHLLRGGVAGSGSGGEGQDGSSGAGVSRAPAPIQRKPANGHEGGQAERQADQAAEKAAQSRETEAPARPLIVEDDAEQLQPGQMRKSEFLDQLHSSVCGAAEEALAGTMWSAMGCPYIDRWFSHYTGQSSQHIERALRRYAPETAGASNARDYIPIITQRLRRGVGQWRGTGEAPGLPEELAQGGMPGLSAAGLMGGLVGGALSALGGAVSGLVSGAGRALSGLGQVLFKGREGGARDGVDPEALRGRMGTGQSLDGKTQARMERAFGADFGGVKVHTDSRAGELSSSLNARAFTIGKDVAFGSGEYRPGTLVGDALIAHELAHVVQQEGATSAAPMRKNEAEYDSLEEDADMAAVDAVVSVWGGARGLPGIGKSVMPRIRSGLSLQRCEGKRTEPVTRSEADMLIRGEYGANLKQAIAAGTSVAGAILRIEDQKEFHDRYFQKYKEQPGPSLDAWVDRDTSPQTIHLQRGRQDPGLFIHEGLHIYGSRAFADSFSNEVNEGTTEYFTRKITDRLRIERNSYPKNYEEVKALIGEVGEAVLRNAYFEGDFGPLEEAVRKKRGEGVLDEWTCHMQLRQFEKARSCITGQGCDGCL